LRELALASMRRRVLGADRLLLERAQLRFGATRCGRRRRDVCLAAMRVRSRGRTGETALQQPRTPAVSEVCTSQT